MSKKKLIKKLVVTSNLHKLSKGKFSTKSKSIANALIANPTYVTNIDPLPETVLTEIQKFDDLGVNGKTLSDALKENSKCLIDQKGVILDMVNDNWIIQVQMAVKGDIAKVLKLGFGVKGVDNGTVPAIVGKVVDSHPIISQTDTNVHQQHTLHIINSETGSKKQPADAISTYIYQLIGTTAPSSINQMSYKGIVSKGKYINKFDSLDLGKVVYYIAIYVNKKTLELMEPSPVSSAIIN
ncbi:MAG: hypothetical protein WCL51_16055 [Bacteroidota bacterium]